MPTMKKMPSVMSAQHSFSQVPSVNIGRSVLDRSHGHKTTFDAGFLVPVFVDEVLPGDTMALDMTAFARLSASALQRPLMDNLYFDSFFFFVPWRLVWGNFTKFMGEQFNPGDSISYVIPSLTVPFTPVIGALADYMGIMPQDDGVAIQTPNTISALPFRAYNRIYNEWFRDENLINSALFSNSDGPDAFTNYVLRKRGKRHDYFTSCLPFLQKGTAVTLPLGVRADVKGIAKVNNVFNAGLGGLETGGASPVYPFGQFIDGVAGNTAWVGKGTAAAGFPDIYADLSTATAANINDLRLAYQVQEFLERDARGGTRYTEIVRSHFGVVSPDARLQRTEYLGGGSTPVNMLPVAQMTQTGLTGGLTPQGNLSGMGSLAAGGHGFHKSFTEHGVLIGIVNVRADLTYQQGIERFWFKQTRYDIYWPEFAHIGEQAVLNQEIWFQGTTAANAVDRGAFGYQERHAEYRYKPSRISGLFRSAAAAPLDNWHLSQKFIGLPTLGQTFIEDDTETILDRVVAVPAEPDFIADLWFSYRCARPMPVFGVPGWGSRF